MQEFEDKQREKLREIEDVGENIIIFVRVVRGGIDATRKGKSQAKEGN